MTLNDSQLVVLTRASNHADGLVDVAAIKAKAPIARHNLLAGLLKKGLLAETKASGEDSTVWRKADGQRLALVLTDAGREAIGVDTAGPETAGSETAVPNSKTGKAGTTKVPKPNAPVAVVPKTPREGTKQAQLIAMLKRSKGATIAEVVEALAWQAHTARAAISHGLGKKLGLTITSEKEKRGRVYRIAG